MNTLFHEELHADLGRVLRARARIEPGTVLVRERPVLTMTALRALAPSQRALILGAVAKLGASTLDLFCTAHAYLHAPEPVRATVLATFCGMEAVHAAGAPGAAHDAVRDVERVAEWCAAHLRSDEAAEVAAPELRQALMCFQLNAHHTPQLGDRRCGALYALGSRFTHACLSANCAFEHEGDLLAHRAVREIRAGEVLTTNYLGPWEYGSARVRRAALLRSKAFECRCETCARGADALRAMPCPACGTARGSDGLLPSAAEGDSGWPRLFADGADGDGGLVLPVAFDGGREEWRCARCGHALSSGAMDVRVSVGDDWPLRAADGSGGLLGWEARVEAAAHNLLLLVYAAKAGASDPSLARLPAILGAVRRLLGRSHWVVPFLLAVQLEATLALASRMARVTEAELLDAAARELGLSAATLGALLARCVTAASDLHRWQRERAPLAATPLFEDVAELAELACRLVGRPALPGEREQAGCVEALLALVHVDLERVRAQLGAESEEAARLSHNRRVLLEAVQMQTVNNRRAAELN